MGAGSRGKIVNIQVCNECNQPMIRTETPNGPDMVRVYECGCPGFLDDMDPREGDEDYYLEIAARARNAALLSAAPDLLRVCKRALEYLDGLVDGALIGEDLKRSTLPKAIRAAIRKAEKVN